VFFLCVRMVLVYADIGGDTEKNRPDARFFRRNVNTERGFTVISMRTSLLLLVCVCLVIPPGCATMGGLSADMSRRDVMNAVEELAATYATGDPDGFMALVSVRYAGMYGALEERVTKDMADAPGAVYVMATGEVTVDDTGRVAVEVRWERDILTNDGIVPDGSGAAVLVFDHFGSVLKLTDQRGNAPFPPET